MPASDARSSQVIAALEGVASVRSDPEACIAKISASIAQLRGLPQADCQLWTKVAHCALLHGSASQALECSDAAVSKLPSDTPLDDGLAGAPYEVNSSKHSVAATAVLFLCFQCDWTRSLPAFKVMAIAGI